jgi:hypothetical protein
MELGEDMRSSILFLLVVCGVAACIYGFRRWREYRQFVWRTESITATILRDEQYLRLGQFLNLDQQLRRDEGGWTNMKIDIPERWTVQAVAAKDGLVTLRLQDGRAYALRRGNVGQLSFEVLDGGEVKSDDELERIWDKYARAEDA